MPEDLEIVSQQRLLPLDFFRQLPKTDLHVHLDGSLRLETIIDLAKRHHVELPSSDPAESGPFSTSATPSGSRS